MKKATLLITLILLITSFTLFAGDTAPKSLKDIYKTGKVHFKEVLRITNDTLPENARYKFCNDLMVDGKDNLFFADSGTQRIFKLSPQGKVIKVFGQQGQGPGDLYLPLCMAHDGEYIYVFEFGNERFSVFDFEGNFIKIYKPKEIEKKGLLLKMASLPDGNFIIGREKTYGKSKPYQEMFLELYGPGFEVKKVLYSQQFSKYKYFDDTSLLFPFPARVSWDLLPGNRVVTGFSKTFELQFHDLASGKVENITREYQPVKVTEKDKKEFFNGIVGYWKGDEDNKAFIRRI